MSPSWAKPEPIREDARVAHALARSARKAAARRFTGEPITGFGELS